MFNDQAQRGEYPTVLSERGVDFVQRFFRKYRPPLVDQQLLDIGSSELRSAITVSILHREYSKGGILPGSLEEALQQEAFSSLSHSLRIILIGELKKAGLAHEFWFRDEIIAWVTPTAQLAIVLGIEKYNISLNDTMGYLQDMVKKSRDKEGIIKGAIQFVKQHGIEEGKLVANLFQFFFDYLDPVYSDDTIPE